MRLFKADTGRCGTEECIFHPWECAAEVNAYPCVYVGGGYVRGEEAEPKDSSQAFFVFLP